MTHRFKLTELLVTMGNHFSCPTSGIPHIALIYTPMPLFSKGCGAVFGARWFYGAWDET